MTAEMETDRHWVCHHGGPIAHAAHDPEWCRFLGWRWSPEQIALTMARVHPKGYPYRVSTETINRCIYAQPVGEQRKQCSPERASLAH